MNTLWSSVGMFSVLCLAGVTVAEASTGPIVHETMRPYEPLAIDAAIEVEQFYLGKLEGDPHMYEVTLSETKQFTATLIQKESSEVVPFSFILVRENDTGRGVSEIGRHSGASTTWETYYDSAFALSLMRSTQISYELTPGVYRFEVSTPTNEGSYLLVLGTHPADIGYFERMGHILTIQKFFDASVLRIVLSTQVLYPLGSLILILLLFFTWRLQRHPHHA
jgi:hypothetical protein